nr:dolichyl P Man:Man(5)GlcNAc(2) PP dolichyl [Hymenolepis microstoma]
MSSEIEALSQTTNELGFVFRVLQCELCSTLQGVIRNKIRVCIFEMANISYVLDDFIALNTEIDWVAYMEQVETFLNGTRDYDQLIGQTGPCVLAVGVKMNILLFAPGFLLVLLKHRGVYETIGHLAECALIQVLLGAVFLFHNSEAYFSRAFEFSRQFMYKWTVNWRLIPEYLFLDRRFQLALLVLHATLLAFFLWKYIWSRGGLRAFLQPLTPQARQRVNPEEVLYPMFVSNFIGLACSRSLHYQFYVWYYHTIPFLLWSAMPLTNPIRFLIFGLIEMSWNAYPSTETSSLTLHICHAAILFGLAFSPIKSSTFLPTSPTEIRKSTIHKKK